MANASLGDDRTNTISFRATLQKFAFGIDQEVRQRSEGQVNNASSSDTSSPSVHGQFRSPKRRKISTPCSPHPPPTTTSPRIRTTSSKASPPKSKKPPTPHDLPCALSDSLAPDLHILFVGANPGLQTASTGWAYAHPSNLFWKLLYSSGCTATRLPPSATHSLPALYKIGNTNLVARPTRDASQLGRMENEEGARILLEKVVKWKPEVVAMVGKGVWEGVARGLGFRKIGRDFKYGWQTETLGGDGVWRGSRVFVATTTSGLAAGMKPWEKEEVWKGLGEWVMERRREEEKRAEKSCVITGGRDDSGNVKEEEAPKIKIEKDD